MSSIERSSIPYSLHQRIQEHCITVSKLDTHFLQLVSFIDGYTKGGRRQLLGWVQTCSLRKEYLDAQLELSINLYMSDLELGSCTMTI